MTARTFIDLVETQHDGAAFLVRDADLYVVGLGTLPPRVRETIKGNRIDLIAYLRTMEDLELTVPTALDPKSLGLVRLENGEWTDVRGDDARDAVLMGVLDPVNPYAPRESPLQDVEDLREVHPGRYAWTERPGVGYRDPFPKIPRIGDPS
jgi:hypothetical protein